jgi:hypothetical protein
MRVIQQDHAHVFREKKGEMHNKGIQKVAGCPKEIFRKSVNLDFLSIAVSGSSVA